MDFLKFLTENNNMLLILAIITLCMLVILYKLDKDEKSSITLTDLVTVDGKLQEGKFTRFGAWVVSTWGFVYLIQDGKLTEWYFVGYMGAWVANALINKALDSKNMVEPQK